MEFAPARLRTNSRRERAPGGLFAVSQHLEICVFARLHLFVATERLKIRRHSVPWGLDVDLEVLTGLRVQPLRRVACAEAPVVGIEQATRAFQAAEQRREVRIPKGMVADHPGDGLAPQQRRSADGDGTRA